MFGRKNSDIHAWVEERLSDYIDNQLAASERAQLDKHLSGCSQCRTSLESFKWTVSLVKQAPAPVSKKSFVLPVPPKRQPTFAFGFASFATALATLLLFAVIGIDFIMQAGGSMTASAPSAAKANAPATQAVALAPQPTPTAPLLFAAPTAAPRAANASSSSSASSAASSSAALPPAPAAAPTRAMEQTRTNGETATTALDSTKSQAASSSSAASRQSAVGASSITATITVTTATLAPASTATSVPPTTIAQAQTVPTLAPVPLPVETSQPVVSLWRSAEIGLLFLAVFFGVLVVLMRRR